MADPEVKDSILASTKKVLGIEDEYDIFDLDITLHINSVFSTLNQLGIGPDAGYQIEDRNNVWIEFLSADTPWLNQVKSYIYLRVRILFDPPATSFAIEAMNAQIKEIEWRLSLYSEAASYSTTP